MSVAISKEMVGTPLEVELLKIAMLESKEAAIKSSLELDFTQAQIYANRAQELEAMICLDDVMV